MRKFGIFASLACCLLGCTSCREGKQYYYTPTLDVEVRGGSRGQVSAPLNTEGESYKPYQGSPYWGEEGKAANQHYTPYDSKDRNLNYYRGKQE